MKLNKLVTYAMLTLSLGGIVVPATVQAIRETDVERAATSEITTDTKTNINTDLTSSVVQPQADTNLYSKKTITAKTQSTGDFSGPAYFAKLTKSVNTTEHQLYLMFLQKGLINEQGQLRTKVYRELTKNVDSKIRPADFNAGIGVIQRSDTKPKLVTSYLNGNTDDPWKGGTLTFDWTDKVDSDFSIWDLPSLLSKLGKGLGFKAKIVLPDNITYASVLRAMEPVDASDGGIGELLVAGENYPMQESNFEPVAGDDHAMYFTLKNDPDDPAWIIGFASFLTAVVLKGGVTNLPIEYKTNINISKLNKDGMTDDTSEGKHLTKGMFAPHADKKLDFGVNFFDKIHIDNNWTITDPNNNSNFAGTSESTWNSYIQGVDPDTGKALPYDVNEDNYVYKTSDGSKIEDDKTTKYQEVWNYFDHQKDPNNYAVRGNPSTVIETGTNNGLARFTSPGLSQQNIFFDADLQNPHLSLRYDSATNKEYYRTNEPWFLHVLLKSDEARSSSLMHVIGLPMIGKQMDEMTASADNYANDSDKVNFNSYDSNVNSQKDNPWKYLKKVYELNGKIGAVNNWQFDWMNLYSPDGATTIYANMANMGFKNNQEAPLTLTDDAPGSLMSYGYSASKAGTYFTGIMADYQDSKAPLQYSSPQFFAVHVRDDVPKITGTQEIKDVTTGDKEQDQVLIANPGDKIESTSTFLQTKPENNETSNLVKPIIEAKLPAGAMIVRGATTLTIKNNVTNSEDTISVPETAWNGRELNYDFSSYASEHGGNGSDNPGMKGEFTYTLNYQYLFTKDAAGQIVAYSSSNLQGYLMDDSDQYTDGPHTFASTNIGQINLSEDVRQVPPDILTLNNDDVTIADNEAYAFSVSWVDYDSKDVTFYSETNGAASEQLKDAQYNDPAGDIKYFQWSVLGKNLKIGENTVKIYAQDTEGNKSEIKTIKINVTKSNQAPLVTIADQATEEQPLEIPDTEDYNLSGNWNDADSESVNVQYIVNGGEPVDVAKEFANETPGTDMPYQATIDQSLLNPGVNNQITVLVTDKEGAVGSQTTFVKPSYQKPEITVDQAEYSIKKGDTSLNVSGTYTDDDSSQVRIYYQIAGQNAKGLTDWEDNSPMATSHQWSGNVDTSAVTEDTTISFYAIDNTDSGSLISEIMTATITVRNPPAQPKFNQTEAMDFGTMIPGQKNQQANDFLMTVLAANDDFTVTVEQTNQFASASKNSKLNNYISYNGKAIGTKDGSSNAQVVEYTKIENTDYEYRETNLFNLTLGTDALAADDYSTTVRWNLENTPKS